MQPLPTGLGSSRWPRRRLETHGPPGQLGPRPVSRPTLPGSTGGRRIRCAPAPSQRAIATSPRLKQLPPILIG
eukprot:1803303-Alexandrium_andersonii.AAC.1